MDLTGIGGDAYLVDRRQEKSYKLDAVAAAIMGRFGCPATVGHVAERLRAEFDVEPEACAAAVDRFVGEMRTLGLLDEYAGPGDAGLRRRYLDLLAKALVNLIYPEHELRIAHLEQHRPSGDRVADQRVLRDIRYAEPEAFDALVAAKHDGLLWRGRVTRDSHTMVGLRRLENLERCAVSVFSDAVPGDFLEAGVCQGGAAVFLRALQVAYGQEHRTTWVADSFEGLPELSHPVDVDRAPDLTEARQPWAAASLRSVQDTFRTYDLLSDGVRFLPGWFADSLPPAPVEQLAILRVDADLYESTRDVLRALYDRVVPGGFVIIDDYWAFEVCREAVDEFLAERQVSPAIRRIDWTAVFWRKTT